MSTKPLFLPNRQVQIIKSSYTDDSHHNRRQESDAEHPEFSQTEFRTVRLDLRKQILRFPFPAYIVAHRESTERHQNIIRYQSSEIKDRLIQDCDITQDAEGQRTRMPSSVIAVPITSAACLRSQPSESIAKEAQTSRSAIALVTAAKKPAQKQDCKESSPRNIRKYHRQCAENQSRSLSRLQTEGKTAGKIAIPARTAITVSRPPTIIQLFGIFSFPLR